MGVSTARIVRSLLVHLFLYMVLLVASTPSSAFSVPKEYQLFKSLCTVVEIPESDLEPVDRALIDKLSFEAIERQVRQAGFAFSIEHGRQCFPGKVGIAPDQLSVRFNVVLARGPAGNPPVILSLTAHAFFRDVNKSPFEYPTKIVFCKSVASLSPCVAQHVSQFFGETTLTGILQAQELLRGTKR